MLFRLILATIPCMAIEPLERQSWDKPGSAWWRLVLMRDYYSHPEVDLPRSIPELARDTGISEYTLRAQIRERRLPSREHAELIKDVAGLTDEEFEVFFPKIDSDDSKNPGRLNRQNQLAAA